MNAVPLVIALSLLAGALAACDEDPDAAIRKRAAEALARREAQRAATGADGTASPSVGKRTLADSLDDAGAIEPAPAGGDLAAEIERFTTVDACVASRHMDDAVLGDALLALGYDGFARDACRVLAAAKQKRRELCRDITVSTLAHHCETVVATVAKDPDACPNDPLGRAHDATCLAFAMRDPRMCAAAGEDRRARCEAMLAADPKHCANAPRAERANCARDAERWRALLGDAPKNAASLPVPSGSFKIDPKNGAPMRGTGDGNLAVPLREGVIVVDERGPTPMRRVELGTIFDTMAVMPSLDPAIRVTLELGAAQEAAQPAGKGARVRKLEVLVPGGGSFTAPPTKSELTVTLKRFEPQRAGALEVVVDGTVGDGDRTYGVHLEAKTFVRDVIGGAAPLPIAPVKPLTVKPR